MRTKKTTVSLPDADKDIDTRVIQEDPHSRQNTKEKHGKHARFPLHNATFGSHSCNLRSSNRVNNNYIGSNGVSESPPPLPQLIFDGNSVRSTQSFLGSTFLTGETGSSYRNECTSSVPADRESLHQRRDGEAWFSNTIPSHLTTDNNEVTDLNYNKEVGLPEERPETHSHAPIVSESQALPSTSSLPSHHRTTVQYHTTLPEADSLPSGHGRHHHHSHKRSHSLVPGTQGRYCKHLHRLAKSSSRSSLSKSSLSLSSYFLSSSSIKLETPEDIADFITTLRRERSRLLQEIEQEDEERSSFYKQLEKLNRLLRHLPHDYAGCERYRVEGEIFCTQEALVERLGTPAVMLRRREQRLHSINAIEKTIQRLRQDNSALSSSSLSSLGGSVKGPSEQVELSQEETHQFQQEMDLLNANEVKDEDGTTDDVSDTKEADSLHSDSVYHRVTPLTATATITSHLNQSSSRGSSETYSASPPDRQKIHPTIEAVLRGTWPFEKALWHSSPASMGASYKNGVPQETVPGIMSTSSVTNRRAHSQHQLLTNKVEMVYGLLSMFSSGDRDDMSRTLLAMSSSPDSCVAMRQSGCLPLLIQLLHGGDDFPPTREARLRAAQALHNIVHSHPDDKRGRREARVLRLLEQIRDYSDYLYDKLERTCAGRGPLLEDDMERHPCPAMAALMKLSFDEEHRHAMCNLGGLHAIAELIRRDHEAHGSTTGDQFCTTLRRYAGMALTNLTFGDGTNKAMLCSFRSFMRAMVSQLHSPSEDLRQVTASVLRNLSWRADGGSKTSLREVGGVTSLTQAALTAKKESTLKVILSAVWNLSAHCSMNKADICNVDGALAFICSTLTYKSQSRTLAIVENGGGILRNISSHIAVRDNLRQVLRDHNTLSILLAQLRSPSLTVVSNACGTLWNLSARCQQDQATLWELGAVQMLRCLINSKHKMISMGSSAALKNLLHAKPEGVSFADSRHGIGLPSLQARKQKALEQELDPSLAETCDNIETSPRSSPTNTQPTDPFYGQPPIEGIPFVPNGRQLYHSLGPQYEAGIMSESRETIASTHSDNSHDRMRQMMRHKGSSKGPLTEANNSSLELSVQSMAPPSHGSSDVAHMSQEELQTHLHSQDLSSSTNEIFAARMKAVSGLHREGRSATPERNGLSGGMTNGHRSCDEPHHSLFSKFANHSRSVAEVETEDHHQKVAQLESKYSSSSSTSKVPKSENKSAKSQATVKPALQINNFMQSNAEELKQRGEREAELDESSEKFENFYDDDQPTDFTLVYNEEDRDHHARGTASRSRGKSHEKNGIPSRSGFFRSTAEEEDSVRTFCTEGTPYQTPYNYSNAASLTDLRDPSLDASKRECKDSLPTEEAIDLEIQSLDSLDIATKKTDGSSRKNVPARASRNPDGMMRYCMEGTPPVSLSRFSSVSSLSSEEINEHIDKELLEDEDEAEPLGKESDTHSDVKEPTDKDLEDEELQPLPHLPNATTDAKVEGSCNETPLMFSRTTSVSSLNSFDVRSIQDDRSSIISDLSRFTSGAISPSDLPDSPSQTVPTSPKRYRPPSTTLKTSAQASRQQTSVFGDSPKAYMDEGTPAEFSHGTSLSSLTFDNEELCLLPRSRGDGTSQSDSPLPPVPPQPPSATTHQSRPANRSSIPRPHSQSRDSETRSRSREMINRLSEPKEASAIGGLPTEGTREKSEPEKKEEVCQSGQSQGTSQGEDERRLAALIQSGMPSARRSGKAPVAPPAVSPRVTIGGSNRQSEPIPPLPPPPPVPSDVDRPSAIPIITANLQVSVEAISIAGPSEQQQGSESRGSTWVGRDMLHNFCTEGTPANISQAGSVSDLSVLSIPGGGGGGSSGGQSPNPLPNPADDPAEDPHKKKLLERCIQSGMPKPRTSIKGKEVRPKERAPTNFLPPTDHSKGVPLLSPRRSPQKPVPVARVLPAIKVGVVSPQVADPPKAFVRHTMNAIDTPPAEELRTYAVEGTPAEFSPAASLSDLTAEAMECSDHPRPLSRSKIPTSAETSPQHGRPKGIPMLFSRGSTPAQSSQQAETQRDAPNHVLMESDEVPKKFMVEDTPAVLSRHSSLSSIGVEDKEDTVPKNRPKQDAMQTYGVENTPVCFSRNSSLSSLSLESYGDEATPKEQALLQKCIKQGMPKSKSDLGSIAHGATKKGSTRIPTVKSPGKKPGIPLQQASTSQQLPDLPHPPLMNSHSSAISRAEPESCKLYSEAEENEKETASCSANIAEESFLDEASLADDLTLRTEVELDSATVPITDVIDGKHIPVSAAAMYDLTSEDSAATVVSVNALYSETAQREASPLCEQKLSSPQEFKISSDGSASKGMDKSTPSCSGSLEGKGSDGSISESGVAAEALRLAKVAANEAKHQSSDEVSQMSISLASVSDFCLEQIKPPSAMGSLLSLSNSMTSSAEEFKARGANGACGNGRRIECRHTRKLPEMVRRALGEQEVQPNDGGSLTSSCHSNLDNIPPPSLMEDDMESSMISVASITSEVVEPRESPPSMNLSMASEVMAEIMGPAQFIANMLLKEAQQPNSSATLVPGEDGSTYQEITDFEHDETLGAPQADGTASDTEMATEDLPQDVPDLPFDSPAKRSLSGSPRIMARNRKSNSRDPFRSRTLSNSSVDSNRSGGPNSLESSPRMIRTPKQRRAEEPDRFRTRTISIDENGEIGSLNEFPSFTSVDSPSPTIGRIIPTTNGSSNFSPPLNGARRSFRQRRLENPSRYQTRTIDVPLSAISPQKLSINSGSDLVEFQDGDDLNLTPEQLEVLSQDANIVICSLNENREAMTLDPLDYLIEENILDIETLSLISMDDDDMLQQIDEDQLENEDEVVISRRPRIVKPGEEAICSNELPAGKGIRGKRRALYSTGRHQGHVPCTLKQTPPLVEPTPVKPQPVSKNVQPGSPKLPRATRASTLRQHSNKGGSSGDESGRTTGSSPGSSSGSSPRLGSTVKAGQSPGKTGKANTRQSNESPPNSLRRQNTFTKDDIESTGSSDKQNSTKSEPKRVTTSHAPRGLPKTKLRKDSVQPAGTSGPSIAAGSSSGSIMKSGSHEWSPPWNRTSHPKSVSLTRDAKPPTAKDLAEWDKESQHKSGPKTIKKDVTSRIANLWRRVERAQTSKPSKDKDSRVWITNTKADNGLPKPLSRSSTFERFSDSKDSPDKTGRTKLGLKLSRLKGRNTRSSPPSEASTPVDSRPQCLVSPTRVTPRYRPPNCPPAATPSETSARTPSDDGKAKRLSRLGSFIVVDDNGEDGKVRSPPLSAVVAPFNYRPKGAPEQRASSLTRIPLPAKPIVNSPRDDNGNATYLPTT